MAVAILVAVFQPIGAGAQAPASAPIEVAPGSVVVVEVHAKAANAPVTIRSATSSNPSVVAPIQVTTYGVKTDPPGLVPSANPSVAFFSARTEGTAILSIVWMGNNAETKGTVTVNVRKKQARAPRGETVVIGL